jgi:hypothetical protein
VLVGDHGNPDEKRHADEMNFEKQSDCV